VFTQNKPKSKPNLPALAGKFVPSAAEVPHSYMSSKIILSLVERPVVSYLSGILRRSLHLGHTPILPTARTFSFYRLTLSPLCRRISRITGLQPVLS
jgi:hypothetical protein